MKFSVFLFCSVTIAESEKCMNKMKLDFQSETWMYQALRITAMCLKHNEVLVLLLILEDLISFLELNPSVHQLARIIHGMYLLFPLSNKILEIAIHQITIGN